jgi:hypothetical protein
MEIESHFLSTEQTRPQLQNHLERMLISLNASPAAVARRQPNATSRGNNTSTSGGIIGSSSSSSSGVECNIILSPAHVLNLKLFHPPKVPACPVPDRAVPVLLKRDRQVQTVRLSFCSHALSTQCWVTVSVQPHFHSCFRSNVLFCYHVRK